jgi:hypothetical protein
MPLLLDYKNYQGIGFKFAAIFDFSDLQPQFSDPRN